MKQTYEVSAIGFWGRRKEVNRHWSGGEWSPGLTLLGDLHVQYWATPAALEYCQDYLIEVNTFHLSSSLYVNNSIKSFSKINQWRLSAQTVTARLFFFFSHSILFFILSRLQHHRSCILLFCIPLFNGKGILDLSTHCPRPPQSP